MLLLLVWCLGGLIGYAAAEKHKRFSPLVGVIFGVLLGLFSPLLFVVSGIMKSATPRARRNPLTVALIGINVVLGLIVVALLIVRYGEALAQ